MRSSRVIAIISLLSAITFVAAVGAHPESTDPHVCICDRARIENGWCGNCGKGYVAGLLIPSAMLYDEIDPHGHEIDKTKIECASCQRALRSNGFCQVCNIGFVSERAYMSKLTYRLAQGRVVYPDGLTCPTCRSNAASHGWCDRCHRGLVGHFSFSDRDQYSSAVAAYGVIEAAVRMLAKCEVCAAAIVGNGYCPKCKRRFRDGRPVTEKSKTNASRSEQSSAQDGRDP